MRSFMKTLLTFVLGTTCVTSTLTVNAPSSPQSGATTTITWTSSSSDPTFSIELTHPSFNHAIAIANNVDPTLDQTTVELPLVPSGDQYTLQFVNITDINQIFATSGDFSIAAAASPSSTVSAASASPTSTSIPDAGMSTPAAMSGIPSASTSIGMVPSPTSPLVPSTAATDSQSAAISGASSAASDTTTPSAANPLAPPFPGMVILLFLAFCTTLLAGAWVL